MKFLDIETITGRIPELLDAPGYKPLTAKELAAQLGVPASETAAFEAALHSMEENGLLTVTKAGKYQSVKKAGYTAARLLSLTKTGGFAAPLEGEGDMYIAKDNLGGALPSDIVLLAPVRGRGRLPEGRVVRIAKRNFGEFLAVYHAGDGKKGTLTADSAIKEPIPVAKNDAHAKDGEKVLARIDGGRAQILSAFGPADSARCCAQAVLAQKHVRLAFSPAVIAEAKEVSARLEDTENRLDLRGLPLLTIDDASAKDLDDAVSLEPADGGWRLGVHIADVSHYVTQGSQLDREALARGTSIYYADSVIPMLPKELSNGICSLNPNEDRLAFTAFMRMDAQGNLMGYEFHKSVIRSRVKGVYAEVNRLFDGTADEDLRKKYAEVLPSLLQMRELARLRGVLREQRGAVDIEGSDVKIVTDENGVAQQILRRVQGEAERMIEEFMLCANEAVATYVCGLKMPLVYRVHAAPELKKLENLAATLKALGMDARAVRPNMEPRDMARIAKTLESNERGRVLAPLVLRAMSKAIYSPVCTGHFGLALKYYCHFTSPIRRYPDLCVHRILTDILRDGAGPSIVSRYTGFTASAAKASSENELTAMQIEWDCEEIYMAEYMSFHLGETFDGIVSTVKPFGIYIALENGIEGMCRVENIPGGYYDYDERTMTLFCRQNGRRYSLGDKLRVAAARADVSSGQIDFSLVQG